MTNPILIPQNYDHILLAIYREHGVLRKDLREKFPQLYRWFSDYLLRLYFMGWAWENPYSGEMMIFHDGIVRLRSVNLI